MTLFEQKILDLVRKIPQGKITTYEKIALKLGNKYLVRFIGNCLAKNLHLITIPCHRVVRKDQKVGNYALGVAKKINLLQNEGIIIKRGKIVNFNKVLYDFNLN